jgi:hypothetical protein
MNFEVEEILDDAIAMLQRWRRVTYSILKLQFELDDEQFAVLKDELLYSQPHVVDDPGRGLIWTGEPDTTPTLSRSHTLKGVGQPIALYQVFQDSGAQSRLDVVTARRVQSMSESSMDRPEAKRWFEVWKHYETAADARKEELFKTGTWQLGLMAAIFAYAVKEGVGQTLWATGFREASILVGGGVMGLLLAFLTRTTVREVNTHIVSSWRYANHARLKVPELIEVLGTPTDPPDRTNPAKRLWRVVWVFIGVFVALIALGAPHFVRWAMALIQAPVPQDLAL